MVPPKRTFSLGISEMDCSNRPFDWAGNVRLVSKLSIIREMFNELEGVVGLPHEWRFAFQAGVSWAGLSIASRTATLSRDFGNECVHPCYRCVSGAPCEPGRGMSASCPWSQTEGTCQIRHLLVAGTSRSIYHAAHRLERKCGP